MKLTLSCPNASYDAAMRIRCSKANGAPCAFQYFRACKGWWVLRPNADKCLLRKEEKDGP